MSLSSSPPPGSKTGTPRPYTVVSLPLSSSPDSSPEPTMFLRLSSSPDSSPERKRKREDEDEDENEDEDEDEDEEQSPDGSCNQGPLSPGTPSPCHEPASPSYSETSYPPPYRMSLSTIEENKLEVIHFLGARSRNFFPDISDAPLGWLSNTFLKISKENEMDPCDVVEEIIICVAKHATWEFVAGFYVEIKHFEYGDFSDMLLDERSKHVNYDKEKEYFAALDWWS
jgi:hypothetical protein